MSNSDDQSQTETEDCGNSPVSPSTVKKRFNRQTSGSLRGSGRSGKHKNLSKQIITVQKEDGDIGHIEVNVPDENFSTQQSILQSLAELGEIPSPAPASPVPGKLKEVRIPRNEEFCQEKHFLLITCQTCKFLCNLGSSLIKSP